MSGIDAIQAEQERQRTIGWDAHHDTEHSIEDWLYLIEKRMLEIRDPWAGNNGDKVTPYPALMAQIGALAASALDAHEWVPVVENEKEPNR